MDFMNVSPEEIVDACIKFRNLDFSNKKVFETVYN